MHDMNVSIPARAALRPIVTRTLAVIACLVAACALAALTPLSAEAYEMPRVCIEATVLEDGALHVEEERTFAFDDEVNGVFWTIPIASNEQGRPSWVDVASLSAAIVDEGGAERALERVGEAQPGDDGVFTVTEEDDAIRIQLFSPHADDTQATFRLSYGLTGAVMAWADTAELYWKFVGPDWEESSENVELTVRFAGADASGEDGVVGENFRAWAHGPLEGEVALDGAVPSVTATVPRVRDGEYAEVRVVFPRSWVPGLAPVGDAAQTERMDRVLSEEAGFAEDANARRAQMQALISVGSGAQIALPAVLLVVVAAYRILCCRAPKADFQQEYLREVPTDAHPATVAASMDDGRVGRRSFVVTLMKLTDEGVIDVSDHPAKDAAGEASYRLVLRDPARLAESGIDGAALRLFFREDAQLASFAALSTCTSGDASTAEALTSGFTDAVERDLKVRGLVASVDTFKSVATVAAAVLFCASLILALATDGATLLPFGIGLALTIVALVIALTARIVTREAAELRARCEAFRHWIERAARTGEAVDFDSEEGRLMLVYASAVGVGEGALRRLVAQTDESSAHAAAGVADVAYAGVASYPYPLMWWFWPHYGMHASPMRDASDAYGSAVASVAVSAGSPAAGTGGGFSFGGGGGVGGGGGGTF
ncbi:DUF2207 domain-containing protein [Collinsella sp. An307]|uniref:DUF2207 domain-containing protein n=1 Tax=Collinsella sp. An307 TaxID=1965630 RepID=UPI000B3A9BF5|nr:DUF2207 domain-containing protein [Collinsella sp. An307]OUO19271.1 hypothetical protein B5F89_08470 [Collinsella sp. An307]